MKKVKFAIIGCGRIAYRHIEAIQSNPRAELVALCDLDIKRAEERNLKAGANIYTDYRQMFAAEEIDVVNIMTPSGMHAEHAIEMVLDYNKHVVVEKPLCLRIDEGLQLIKTAAEVGKHIFVVHQNRFNKAVQKLRQVKEEQLLDRITLATVRLRWARDQQYYDQDPWRGTYALDGGVLTNQAIHHIDLLRWLAGDVESVSAIAATQLVDVEVEDTACAWLRFRNGALGVIEATNTSRPRNHDLEASVSIMSSTGTAIVEGASVNKLTTWTLNNDDISSFSETPPNVYGFGHNIIIDNVVSTLQDGDRPLVGPEDALESIKLLNAIYYSIECNGQEVKLDDNPVSGRLGIIDERSLPIANLYRTREVMKDE